MQLKYLNKNDEELYILHFPGDGLILGKPICLANLERLIKVSDRLSIISIMTPTCQEKDSFINKQCKLNNINIINTYDNTDDKWNNRLKIEYILQALDQINTEFALILDGRDTIIVNNLDDQFINKFIDLNMPIIYNGTPLAYPANTCIEPIQQLMQCTDSHKFLNAGICIGYKDKLKEFYQLAKVVNDDTRKTINSEQFVIRKARQKALDICGIDTKCKIFRLCHQYDTVINKINDTAYKIL